MPVWAAVTQLPGYTLGDVSVDKAVSAADALLVLQYAVGKELFTPGQQLAADVSGDEKCDTNDALLILRHTVGKLPVFPAADPTVFLKGKQLSLKTL